MPHMFLLSLGGTEYAIKRDRRDCVQGSALYWVVRGKCETLLLMC
jgi:hypothetical protein